MDLRMESGSVLVNAPRRCGVRWGMRKGVPRDGGGCQPALFVWSEGNGRAVLL